MPIIDGEVVRARFHSLKINELSSVDRPAQPGALAVLLKTEKPAVVAKFLDLVEAIQKRDSCARTTALSKARVEHSEAFNEFQGSELTAADCDKSTANQTGRAAAQREFLRQADLIRRRDGCSGSESLSRARREAPDAFAAAYR
jgi:hypothetical protein